MRHRTALLAVLAILSACGRNGGEVPSAKAPQRQAVKRPLTNDEIRNLPEIKRLPPKELEKFLADRQERAEAQPALDAERAKERAELVLPAPPGLKPQAKGRKLKLTLIPRDKTSRVGERFWFKLELQNVGSEPARVFQGQAYFKSGDLGVLTWKFLVNGKRVPQLVPRMFHAERLFDSKTPWEHEFSPPGFERLSPEEKSAYVDRYNREARARQWREETLEVTLAPGETLVTRPWRFYDNAKSLQRIRDKVPLEPVKGPFRQLGAFVFRKPGKHTFQALHDPWKIEPPTERHLRDMEARGVPRERVFQMNDRTRRRSLEPLESNIIEVEVLE